ncbi:hypothetical protein [Lentibacillus amyloliquefaciens]|uniref:Uncharacterized protein n=1 Tax=Lentibacillus amyloliquefaciens TaxID=1472767 RepID=A0A0U4FKN8_9BACI|nr:hypothetical protein [Lentibacillus amyloliquefaciens]ALX48292.1 hypothetical protein AOX59_06530 [Lentibacillus amyloliquefaciens]
MLGLPKGEVFLVLWPEDWLKEFLLDKEKQEKIGKYIVDVHHIGSTAAEGVKCETNYRYCCRN